MKYWMPYLIVYVWKWIMVKPMFYVSFCTPRNNYWMLKFNFFKKFICEYNYMNMILNILLLLFFTIPRMEIQIN